MIVGTKPIVCKYKGHIYFPCLGYYARSWENPIFRQRPLPQRLSDAASRRKIPRAGPSGRSSIRTRTAACATTNGPASPAIPSGTEGRPSRYNWFGTNQQGFDVFAQMVHGTQIALSVGFVSMGIAAAIGITLGALAGYFGGWVDMLLSR